MIPVQFVWPPPATGIPPGTPRQPPWLGLLTGSPLIPSGGCADTGRRMVAVLWHRNKSRSAAASQLDVNWSGSADIEFILDQISQWIRNADTKTGLLLTGLIILLDAISSRAKELRALWASNASRPAALWFLGVAVVLLAIAFTLLVAVLLPRTRSSGPSRYAWPWIAKAGLDDLERLKPNSLREEGWRQAKQLADIAAFKYRYFARAVWVTAGSVGCLMVWTVLRP